MQGTGKVLITDGNKSLGAITKIQRTPRQGLKRPISKNMGCSISTTPNLVKVPPFKPTHYILKIHNFRLNLPRTTPIPINSLYTLFVIRFKNNNR